MPPLGIIHITAAYSNAVLVAILPHISNFAEKLDLPIQLPVTQSQVRAFKVNYIQDDVGGGLYLTNHYQFAFDMGYVNVFHNLTNNPFIKDNPAVDWKPFAGVDNMTENDAITFSRNEMVKLGYSLENIHMDQPPYSYEGSLDLKTGEHIPYCEVVWDNEKTVTNINESVFMEFQIDLERKQLVGMGLVSRKFWQTNPPISIKPELESDYRKRMHVVHEGMFTNTNAPATFGQ